MKLIDRLAPLLYIAWNNSEPPLALSQPPFDLEIANDDGETILHLRVRVTKMLAGNRVILLPEDGPVQIENGEQMEKFCAIRKELYRQSPDYVPASDGIYEQE